MKESEFFNQYGDVEVVFSSYYKYWFYFSTMINDKKLLLRAGGESDEIYRWNFSAGVKYKIKEFKGCHIYAELNAEELYDGS